MGAKTVKKRMIILLLGMIWLFAACGKAGSDREIPGSEVKVRTGQRKPGQEGKKKRRRKTGKGETLR